MVVKTMAVVVNGGRRGGRRGDDCTREREERNERLKWWTGESKTLVF